MGLTCEIGEFVSAIGFAGLPPGAAPIVARGFTDCVAVTMAGLREPVTGIVATFLTAPFDPEAVARLEGIVGVTAQDLALLYGTAAHALDYDDTGLSGHPSAVLVPAILAEANDIPATGRDMIAAYVAGYEVWAELIRRDRDQHHQKGWHPSGLFGAVAAAAACAVLRKLNAEQAGRAVGIAASLAGGVVANFGSMTKPFHLGRAAQSGITATRLAQAGMTAAPDALEHPLGFLRAISPRGRVDTDSEAMLGREWRILAAGVNVKLYPMCYATHRAIDAMLDLCGSAKLSAGEIQSVDVELGDNQAAMLRNHQPQTALDARFSAQFAVAVAAIAKRCTQAELTDGFVQRPDIQEFFGKVRLCPTSEKDPEEPALAPFDRVKLTCHDGRILVSDAVAHPRGHFKRGIDAEAFWQKFSDCAADVVGPERARDLFDRLQDLPNLAGMRDLRPVG